METRIRDVRAERGWTVRRLAEESGVDKNTISDVERGLRKPNPITMHKLAKALGVEVRDLFPLGQAPPPLEEREAAGGRIVTGGANLKGTGTLDVGEGFVLIGERRLAQIIERTTRGELSANEAMAAALGKAETT